MEHTTNLLAEMVRLYLQDGWILQGQMNLGQTGYDKTVLRKGEGKAARYIKLRTAKPLGHLTIEVSEL